MFPRMSGQRPWTIRVIQQLHMAQASRNPKNESHWHAGRKHCSSHTTHYGLRLLSHGQAKKKNIWKPVHHCHTIAKRDGQHETDGGVFPPSQSDDLPPSLSKLMQNTTSGSNALFYKALRDVCAFRYSKSFLDGRTPERRKKIRRVHNDRKKKHKTK